MILVLYNLRPSSLQEVCHQYWPTGDTKGGKKYGEFNVSVLQVMQQDGFIQRMLSVTNPKVRDEQICLRQNSAHIPPAFDLAVWPGAQGDPVPDVMLDT